MEKDSHTIDRITIIDKIELFGNAQHDCAMIMFCVLKLLQLVPLKNADRK
jgi:hypothetical protein